MHVNDEARLTIMLSLFRSRRQLRVTLLSALAFGKKEPRNDRSESCPVYVLKLVGMFRCVSTSRTPIPVENNFPRAYRIGAPRQTSGVVEEYPSRTHWPINMKTTLVLYKARVFEALNVNLKDSLSAFKANII